MEIIRLEGSGFAANCYLVKQGSDALLIDPTAAADTVRKALGGAHLSHVLLTHGHFDHMLTAAEIKNAFGAPLCIAAPDRLFPTDGEKNAYTAFFGIPSSFPVPDRVLTEQDVLPLGDRSVRVMITPGHTPGSAVYLIGNAAFTGDTLFAQGFGRCDLFGGDTAQMRASLARLSTLPHSTHIYPGHGEATTLGTALSALPFF